jgi:hypothetical protein
MGWSLGGGGGGGVLSDAESSLSLRMLIYIYFNIQYKDQNTPVTYSCYQHILLTLRF